MDDALTTPSVLFLLPRLLTQNRVPYFIFRPLGGRPGAPGFSFSAIFASHSVYAVSPRSDLLILLHLATSSVLVPGVRLFPLLFLRRRSGKNAGKNTYVYF